MEYTQLINIITDTNNNNRYLYNFMIQNPTYDYKVIIELALMYNN